MINIIAAMAKNRVIGRDNAMPWHISRDFKYFKAQTMGKSMIMGRKTYESLGAKPLPGRLHYVISRTMTSNHPDVTICPDLDSALAQATGEIMIIGGGSVYEQALPIADRLYLTEIDANIEGDTYFTDFSKDDWKLISSEKITDDDQVNFNYSFNVYER